MTDSTVTHRRRFDNPGEARFLTFSCFHRRPFLRSQTACAWLGASLTRACRVHEIALWAYVFMPEHVHLLVCPLETRPSAGEFLRSLKRSVTQKAALYRERSARPDTDWEPYLDVRPNGEVAFRFWQRGGGYDRNLWTPGELREKLDYIHKNPVTRGLAATPTEWRWSSARYHAGLDMGPVPLHPMSL
jgi:putative transposase